MISTLAICYRLWIAALLTARPPPLIASLEEHRGCRPVTLEKELGETCIAGTDRLDRPRWQWPSR